jgi:electron transfer flavoprotein alpha subunit
MCWSPARRAGVADAAAKLDGVEKVLLADAPLRASLAEPLAALIVSLRRRYDAIVSPATTTGQERDAARRRVARRDAESRTSPRWWHPTRSSGRSTAGNAIQTVKSKDAKKVITVRTSTFQATGEGGSASVENATAAADPGVSSFVGEELSKSERPELTSAKIIISGGRAMQSRDNFTKYIEPGGRQARRCGRRLARRGRCRLCAERLAGRARPARWWRRSSTSRSAFRARSSISPA